MSQPVYIYNIIRIIYFDSVNLWGVAFIVMSHGSSNDRCIVQNGVYGTRGSYHMTIHIYVQRTIVYGN